MKPKKVVIVLASILIILGVVSFVFPKQGVNVFGTHLSFPSLSEIFFNKDTKYANIENIVASSDTLSNDEDNDKKVEVKKSNIVEFEYPNNNTSVLYSFFEELDRIKTNNLKVRILHYGDSQLEGDRISSYIRRRLQEQFGGEGQGEIPIHSLSSIKNVSYKYSPNWSFYSIINLKRQSFNHYGLMMSAARPYMKTVVDSLTHDTTYMKSAYVELSFANKINKNLHLYYSNPIKHSTIKVYSNKGLIMDEDLEVNNSLLDMAIPISSPTSYLKIVTTGSPELYSIDQSITSGVYLDNISLRGSSGWGMSYNNPEFFSSMAARLNVNLIIMQFGVNVIPQDPTKIIKSYDFYEKEFSKQLAFLKRNIPNAAIIVIGVSDRSVKVGESYKTNPNVEKVLAAQKQAAMENGCVFWDLFKAMGGKNSMPSWVLREHPLANPDFIHFNNTGAKYVSELFYQALNNAYLNYKNKH